MDVKQSVAHFKDILQKAGGLGHPIAEVWNEWAKELMQERGWDEDAQCYLEPPTLEWEEKANIIFGSNTFQLNYTYGAADRQIQVGKYGVLFEKCIFPGEVTFLPGQYEHSVNFENADFLEGATFESCTFMKTADFSKVKSFGSLDFQNAVFKGSALFEFLEIYNKNTASSFANVSFEKRGIFSSATFESNIDFSGSKFFNLADFSHTNFWGDANFSAIISERSFILEHAEFAFHPDFTSYRMNHLPYINGTDVERPADNVLWAKRYVLNDEIRKLQSLKALAIQAHDHEMETYFFAEEMRCKYLKLKAEEYSFIEKLTSLLNRIPYFVYRVLSNYGLSIIRPTVSWFCLILSLTVIYSKFSIDKMCTALYLSILHSLPVFGLFKTDNQKLAAQALEHQNRWWDLIYISHNILASLLVFLLFQAIRNRFKIK